MYRTLLFVPGDRPDRYDKALAAGADAVCIDLEDAVALPVKAQARAAVVAYLAAGRRAGLGVRINPLSTGLGGDDCNALRGLPMAFVMMPKAESAAEVAEIKSRLGPDAPPLMCLIESALGLRNVEEIAAAPGVRGLLFGAYDLSADIGCAPEWEVLLYARSRTMAAAAVAGVGVLETPWLDVNDEAGLIRSAQRARMMGFSGCACIHPVQIGPVRAAFAPSENEIAQARRVLAAYDKAKGGVALMDGTLIEAPVVRAARRTLATANIEPHDASDNH